MTLLSIRPPAETSDAALKAHACPHTVDCPAADAPDHDAACRVASHPEQGWTLLCNGVICFEDTGELLPDGSAIPPHRPTDPAIA